MCKKCVDFERDVFEFEGSHPEREAFHDWLAYNPQGDLSEFRDSDEWAQVFCDEELAS